MARRHPPIDMDYVLSSKYYDDVRAEMQKVSYLTAPKDVEVAKQAEQMGFTASECATVIIRNRRKPNGAEVRARKSASA
jgi:hypothetical protein